MNDELVFYKFNENYRHCRFLEILEDLIRISKINDKHLTYQLIVSNSNADIKLQKKISYDKNSYDKNSYERLSLHLCQAPPNEKKMTLKDFLMFFNSLANRTKKNLIKNPLYVDGYISISYFIRDNKIYFS